MNVVEEHKRRVMIRVTRMVPVCCGRPMVRYSGSSGNISYYRCPLCKSTDKAVTTKERID